MSGLVLEAQALQYRLIAKSMMMELHLLVAACGSSKWTLMTLLSKKTFIGKLVRPGAPTAMSHQHAHHSLTVWTKNAQDERNILTE